MRRLGLAPGSTPKKSAKVVGDVMGSFHPHGDQAIYDALVRLAQDFAVRYPLIDGQGNFGNVDGDNPAAMRYTESKLTEAAQSLLDGLDEDAVDSARPMMAATRSRWCCRPRSPTCSPTARAASRVGMATSIPPHNLGELCAALIQLIENPNIQDRTLFKLVRGPDFPTGGILMDDAASIAEAFKTGRGSFRIRACWKKEEGTRGMYQLVVHEIPYQVQKAKLIERIAELLEQKKLPLLDDVHDESTEDVAHRADAEEPHRRTRIADGAMFRQTDLETRFPLNMNVLDKGLVPRVMSLREGAERLHRSPPRGSGTALGPPAGEDRGRGSRFSRAISPSI